MSRRTGVPTLWGIATLLCKALGKFTPVIQVLYPTNVALLLALDAANLACVELRSELNKVREFGD